MLPRGPKHARERRKGILFIILATISWSFPALAIKYLTGYMDAHTQNFVRFLSAALFLWTVSLLRSPRQFFAEARVIVRLLPAAAASFAYQCCYVFALDMPKVFPGLAYILIKSTVFFTAALSCIFFADERRVMRDRRFVIGAVLSVVGLTGFVAIVSLTSGNGAAAAARGPALVWGVLLILLGSIFWSLYTVLIKLLVRRGSPLFDYTYICTLIMLGFGVLTLLRGGRGAGVPGGLHGLWVWFVAVSSGAVCVGAAHVLFYHSIRRLGTTVCGLVSLSNTWVTPLLSVLVFGERLSLWHIGAGAFLVAGAVFTLQAKPVAGEQ